MSSAKEATPLLEMRQVEKHFGGVVAIDRFNLSVMPREIYGLIGPNGAGKTTIFNTITGIYTADSGRIFFDGRDITKVRPHEAAKAGIARTFQNIRLFSNLSVKMNVYIACQMRDHYNLADALFRLPRYRSVAGRVEEKAMGLLERVGLADKADALAGSLPYGHQRKLEIARAMATDPKLLLLDEPAAGMNEEESDGLVKFLQGLHREYEITILLIEHHMDVVSKLCEECTVLDFGKVLASGRVEDVKKDEAVVAAYLGGEL